MTFFTNPILNKLYWPLMVIYIIVLLAFVMLYFTEINNWSDRSYYNMMNMIFFLIGFVIMTRTFEIVPANVAHEIAINASVLKAELAFNNSVEKIVKQINDAGDSQFNTTWKCEPSSCARITLLFEAAGYSVVSESAVTVKLWDEVMKTFVGNKYRLDIGMIKRMNDMKEISILGFTYLEWSGDMETRDKVATTFENARFSVKKENMLTISW